MFLKNLQFFSLLFSRLIGLSNVSYNSEINIGVTHVFSCINICWVLRKLFEHMADRPSAQSFPEGPGKC